MKPYFWLVLLVNVAVGCSSGDTGQNAECKPIDGECLDSSECCPGSLCAATPLNPLQGSCTQICARGVDCDSGCCHAIKGTSDKVCDIATACEDGAGGTSGAGGMVSVAGTGNMSTVGGDGSGGDPAIPGCEEVDVPGDSPVDGLDLVSTTDCNNTPLKHAGEALSGGDVDWFTYGVTDEAGCVIEGTASVTGGDVELCAFGDLPNCEITCSTGTAAEREGFTGCCASGSNPKLSWSTGCGIGESASGTMLLAVSSTSDACMPYELGYGF